MNFILENGIISKLVATLIGICILSLVVVFVWFKKRKELREKEKRQQAIRLRHELVKNRLLVLSKVDNYNDEYLDTF